MEFLEWTVYANSLRAWIIALAAAGAAFIALRIALILLRRQLARVASRTRTDLDDVVLAGLDRTRAWFLIVIAIWIGSLLLVLATGIQQTFRSLVALVTLGQIGIWGGAMIAAYVEVAGDRYAAADAARVTTLRALGFLATLTLWTMMALVGLGTMGLNVTALVTGLGIGGIAVALAVQNVLGDLFASLSIVLDKPFVYGDYIVVDDAMGTVEKVGLKTTRLRSLSGEQLIVSNSDMLRSRIRNYERMHERRALFTVGVVYDTPRAEVEGIPALLRAAVEAQADVRFDRAHFKGFGASSLDFEVVYYVLGPDYVLYMDRQQAINLEILRSFEAAGIEFAYPTRTVHLIAAAE